MVRALSDIDLIGSGGQSPGREGPSGNGKSTLLPVVAGILEPSAGCWLISGETVWDGHCRRVGRGACRAVVCDAGVAAPKSKAASASRRPDADHPGCARPTGR